MESTPNGDGDLVLRRCRLPDGRGPLDIAIVGGAIREISESIARPGASTLEVDGRLVAPAFVDAHVYLDKVHLADEAGFRPDAFGERDLLDLTQGAAGVMGLDAIERRARRFLSQAVRHGTTVLRGVADVYPEIGTKRVELFLRLKEEFSPRLDLQILAYPQFGVVRAPGTLDLLREALVLGADVLGGAPAFDSDLDPHLDLLFGLAQSRGCRLHFSLDMDLLDERPAEKLEVWGVIERTLAAGYEGRVSVGHLCALDSMSPREAGRAIEAVRRARLNVLVFASAQLYRQGRDDPKGVRRGLTRVKEFLAAGVNVAYASNDVRDAFNPFGNGDLLLEGLIAAQAAHLGSDDELNTVFEMGTKNAARVLGIEETYGIEVGKRADLVVFDAPSAVEAIRSQSEKSHVIKRGRLVARNQRVTEFVG